MASVISTFTGCTPLKQYRTQYTNQPGSVAETNAIEETSSNLLGFVEFDDHGWLWDAKQMHAVVERIAQEDQKQGLIIVVFAHGWKHNASWEDANVASFRGVLADLQDVENKSSTQPPRPPRKVVGLYVGWRGLSQTLPVLKEFTFYERKRTAHSVGQGAVCELMAELDKLRKQSCIRQKKLEEEHKDDDKRNLRQPTLLILVGHSFGGAVTYSALAPYLQERLVDNLDDAGHEKPPPGFGDLVVLINPAFEAARFEMLKRSSDERTFGTNQAATIAILTSKADWATKYAFKAGRVLSTIFERNRKDEDQYGANVTAVGHFRPYITHDLNAKKPAATPPSAAPKPLTLTSEEVRHKTAEAKEASAARVQQLRAQVRATKTKPREKVSLADSTYEFSASVLVPRPATHKPHDPVYVVAVDPKIIPSHDKIDKPEFITFLREFILAFSANPQAPQ